MARLDEMAWKNIGVIRSLSDQEYATYVLEARSQYLGLRLRHDPAIKELYVQAAESVANTLRELKPSIGELTRNHLTALEKSLRSEAEKIGKASEALIKDGIKQAFELGTYPSDKKLFSAITESKVGLDLLKLQRGFGDVNTAAVEALWARTIKELKVSDRIWKSANNARENMLGIIRVGLVSGRDAVSVAKDLERYVRDGAKTLAEDYPKMMARFAKDMPEWAKKAGFYRIPKDLSYEALRLVRTEYNNAFFEGVYSRGTINPSYQGCKYMLSDSHPEPDICDALAEADYYGMGPGVYKKGQEPKHPHPNCLCYVYPVLLPTDKFVADLIKWKSSPESVPYIDQWYKDIYQPMALQSSGSPSIINDIVQNQIFIQAKTINGAEKWARENDLADIVDWDGVHIDVANEWNQAVWEAQKQFPELREKFTYLGTAQGQIDLWYETAIKQIMDDLAENNPGMAESIRRSIAEKYVQKPKIPANAYAQSISHEFASGIAVNKVWGSNPDKFKECIQSDVAHKFHPVGCTTLRSIIDHEIGHQIDNIVLAASNKELIDLYNSLSYEEIRDKLSVYATESINEFIAEAWAEKHNNTNPRALALEIYNVIMKLRK